MAGIMLSSILSDTLLFKSPTTTDMDIEVGKELAKIADVDIEDYGYKMFKAASSVAGMSIEDIINFDMKKYKYENSYLAIGQVMTMDFEEISKRKDEIIESLNDMCKHGDCAMAMLFITDVIKNGSYVYFNEGAEENIELAYGTEAVQGMYMDDVVSRKKQMLPPLLENE
jgi:manganese-dependent inorganic pyrophosphatase